MRSSALLLLALLTGCATTPIVTDVPAPTLRPAPGMERLMDQPAETAIALLGNPSLDRREGAARQLQYAGACILDIFYFQKAGQAPLAVHAEARLPNGRDVAAGECMQALLKARNLVAPQG